MSEVIETGKPEWLKRAEAEQKELWERLRKLNAALGNANVRATIDPNDLEDMTAQERAMNQYNWALVRRIKRNGGTVCE